jgi:hypothetical protein
MSRTLPAKSTKGQRAGDAYARIAFLRDKYPDTAETMIAPKTRRKAANYRHGLKDTPTYRLKQHRARQLGEKARETLTSMPGTEMWEMAKAKRRFEARAKQQ